MLPVESLKQAKLLAEQGNTQDALDLLNKSYQTLQENMPDPISVFKIQPTSVYGLLESGLTSSDQRN